jgi:23S rRNA (cytidine1920-2'-O)/16S rRNA (cytidine1409-2'-O)-methyltransferase
MRLDLALVARGLAPSRARARDLINRGAVRVGGLPASKPAALIAADASIEVDACDAGYVSRGAAKLMAALGAFGFDPSGRACLDIGASTGGFTEVLLERGAARVYAVDVGTGQLHPRLAADPRVVSLERTDARRLEAGLVPEQVTGIVADVSFISLTLALPAALRLAASGCWLAVLVKPQFEAGRDSVGKGGIVRDEAAREAAVMRVRSFIERCGWRIAGVIPSPVAGGDGNIEYLLGAALD